MLDNMTGLAAGFMIVLFRPYRIGQYVEISGTSRVDLALGIGYDDDPGKAMGIVHRVALADPCGLGDPEPGLRVTSLGDSAVEITARLWVAAPDYWDVKFELIRAVKEAFDAQGITIPYPHRVMVQAAG
jgi:small conductance mechanosensitive channel